MHILYTSMGSILGRASKEKQWPKRSPEMNGCYSWNTWINVCRLQDQVEKINMINAIIYIPLPIGRVCTPFCNINFAHDPTHSRWVLQLRFHCPSVLKDVTTIPMGKPQKLRVSGKWMWMVHVVYTLISVMVLIDKKFARGGSKYDVYIYIQMFRHTSFKVADCKRVWWNEKKNKASGLFMGLAVGYQTELFRGGGERVLYSNRDLTSLDFWFARTCQHFQTHNRTPCPVGTCQVSFWPSFAPHAGNSAHPKRLRNMEPYIALRTSDSPNLDPIAIQPTSLSGCSHLVYLLKTVVFKQTGTHPHNTTLHVTLPLTTYVKPSLNILAQNDMDMLCNQLEDCWD